jgi:hypothetical protein
MRILRVSGLESEDGMTEEEGGSRGGGARLWAGVQRGDLTRPVSEDPLKNISVRIHIENGIG